MKATAIITFSIILALFFLKECGDSEVERKIAEGSSPEHKAVEAKDRSFQDRNKEIALASYQEIKEGDELEVKSEAVKIEEKTPTKQVSQREFEELSLKHNELKKEIANMLQEQEMLYAKYSSEKEQSDRTIEQLRADYKQLESNLTSTLKQNKKLTEENTKLKAEIEKLLSNAKEESKDILNTVADVIKHHDHFHYKIEGDTEALGDKEHNINLSKERADAVKEYLIIQGVSSETLSVEGVDSSWSTDNNSTKEEQLENRRATSELNSSSE